MIQKKYSVLKSEFNINIQENKEYNTLKIRNQLGYYQRIVSFIKKNAGKDDDLIIYEPTHGGYIPIESSKSFKNVYCIISSEQLNKEKQKEHIETNIIEQKVKNVEITYDKNIYYKSSFRTRILVVADLKNKLIINNLIENYKPFLVIILNNSNKENLTPLKYSYSFILSQTQTTVHFQKQYYSYFKNLFHYYFQETAEIDYSAVFIELLYDNLIHFCMIVKNGGEQLKKMLQDNMSIIDRWTILDTGSTDETIETINEVLTNKKEGQLYQEPFINFKDSRNRCLELAGQECYFTIMMDDTYVVQGDLRCFLMKIRGDVYADSFSLFIQSNDNLYVSNRILKSDKKHLRYKYKIHEVIEEIENINVIIPAEKSIIIDRRFEYMETRTINRKEQDLILLFEEIAENPKNPRNYYYVATTYLCMKQYDKAYEYFLKRSKYETGFIQERIDAFFEAARMLNFYLPITNKQENWEKCEELYNFAFALDQTRPESRYFLGIHYFQQQDYQKAYSYLKQGFNLGFPEHCQHSLKPTLSYYFLPLYLTRVCFLQQDYELGMHAATLFLQNKANISSIAITEINEIKNWYKICIHCQSVKQQQLQQQSQQSQQQQQSQQSQQSQQQQQSQQSQQLQQPQQLQQQQQLQQSKTKTNLQFISKQLLIFLVDGGWEEWNGRDLHEKGVGGSETWAIEMARNIANKFYNDSVVFEVKVFCRTNKIEIIENVEYCPIQDFFIFANNPNNKIHTTIVSRYTEYLPAVYNCTQTENVYLINHDLFENSTIIINNPKLKRIFCLTEWHLQLFKNMFPILKELSSVLYYGIDTTCFFNKNNLFAETKEKQINITKNEKEENITYEIKENNTKQSAIINQKIPYRFIYSSFPDRGLLPLLQMWRHIIEIQPNASLSVYSDIYGKWVNEKAPQQMEEIKILLKEYLEKPDKYNLQNYGWVNKSILYEAWKQADIWLYPCIFQETFCLTALEAAASKTFVITNHLAALEDTVGNRGLKISGDPTTQEWQEQTLNELRKILNPQHLKYHLYQHAKQSYINDNYIWASSYSWKGQSDKLCEILLKKK